VGSVYKVIAKVLSKRLRHVLPSLIGETQSAFVQGRQILDGALIANETVQWLKAKKKEGVLLKLDFQKAYDTVDWNALQLVLKEMGFGSKWSVWIKQCISTASISIIVNGAPSKPFRMGRGLRQGDPLSPFLFVLMTEVLNQMLHKALSLGQIRGLQVGANNIMISHLQFADDTLLFCEADVQQLCWIKSLLLGFQAMSGLAVNYHKSGLIVVGKEDEWAQNAAAVLGCSWVQLPIVYLGIPLGANMKKAESWKGVIDKVQRKLQAWKGCCLSRAARLTLIKAVLNCLPIYYLSLFCMPQKVAREIIRIQRRFLWSGEQNARFFPLVKWELVQLPKCKGGLGVGDLVIKNTALLFKWWWRYATEENSLWRRVIQSIHNEDQALLPSWNISKIPGPWQSIKKLILSQKQTAKAFTQNLQLSVGSGSRIRFWEDQWAGNYTLKDKFPPPTQKLPAEASINCIHGLV